MPDPFREIRPVLDGRVLRGSAPPPDHPAPTSRFLSDHRHPITIIRFDFDSLNKLGARELIAGNHRNKSTVLTPEEVEKAKELLRRYDFE